MAQEIVIVETTRMAHPSGFVAWRLSGCFLYPLPEPLETIGPTGPKRIVPTPSVDLPQRWRDQAALDLFRTAELAALDAGDAVFATFDETFTQLQVEDPAGSGIDRLRDLYQRRDPRPGFALAFAHTGRRLNAS